MSEAASALVFALFLIFCRIGTCLMLMPGFSSSRIPAQVRLFLSLAISLALSPALSPIILPQIEPLLVGASDADRLHLIASELLNGFFIGLLGRVFLIALSFAGHVIANAIGMGQAMGPVFEDGPDPTISTLITFTATTLIFVLNLHAEIARALVASYSAMPAANGFSIQASLINIADNLDEAFMLCLRISSRHRQFRHRSRQQADADHPDLLHLAALRSGRRARPLRLCDRRLSHPLHAGIPAMGAQRMREGR